MEVMTTRLDARVAAVRAGLPALSAGIYLNTGVIIDGREHRLSKHNDDGRTFAEGYRLAKDPSAWRKLPTSLLGLRTHPFFQRQVISRLLDYNRKRMMFSIGVSLVDW